MLEFDLLVDMFMVMLYVFGVWFMGGGFGGVVMVLMSVVFGKV